MAKYNEVISALQKQHYAPVYFLYGEEPYYIDLVADYIENNVLDPMNREFDQTIIYGKDYERDMAPIISAARRYPMMAQQQVIIVKEAQNIKNWEPLGIYLKQMMPTTLLVFCYKYGTPDKRQKVFKELEKAGGIMMESAKVRDYKIQAWIADYIKEWNAQKGQQIHIDEKIVALLAESLGNDLQRIVNELQKLVHGLPSGETRITAEIVERNIGISKDFNIFELEDALIKGDIQKANRIVKYFAESKQHPLQKEILSLFGFFQNLLIYEYLPNKQEHLAAQALGINPYFIKNYAAAANRFNAGKTFRIIGYIREADARSKGINYPSANEQEIWKELIYKIMH
ncbi:MAG: DNA polymerase III subunit delta [Paludibacter sp.]|nr:DNA polymerase III subunit delta [Bacteroidales bacterium]MCM1069502.1 DNA polymerase III subunit delta [Prevotella sp.]MCM1354158.1 DNA polymerase III subunit delta [Bacteroides sp.]MCM1442985.1 DNA polymerase III subunit delta [Muribaculum sp.]MCM1482233.1 DNA polymerase III subunit delta [Paludibacter sp.]